MRDELLTRECVALHRYLMGGPPSEYVVEKYEAAHRHLPALTTSSGWFDNFLLAASQRYSWLMRMVQVYARIFAPAAMVRKKAVLLLAIVECCAPALVSLQAARTRSPAVAVVMSTGTVVAFAFLLLVAALVLAPIQLASAVASKPSVLPERRPAVREVA